MVADTLWVDTKRVYAPHKSSEPLNIMVEGQESIFLIKEGKREIPGTTTKLFLRDQNPWERLKEDEFIKSVENVIPNPPFKINIETSSHQKTRDENSFMEVVASSIKDFSWREHSNIRMFDIKLDNLSEGIIGSVTVAILESHGKPVPNLELKSRNVEIEGNIYTLERRIKISENSISESSKSITINDDGDINEDNSVYEFAKSKSKFSLHGIEIPSSLFPQSWQMKNNQVRISWPFPLLFVVDICGKRDLDLNSSRTEIIMSEKWIDFEEKLATIICTRLSELTEPEYWGQLKEIFKGNSKNKIFIKALDGIK